MRKTTKNGEIDISYRVMGDGDQELVFVHGWMVSGAVFDALIERLDHDEFRFIVPDLRGAGESSTSASSYKIDDYASDVLAVVDDAGAEIFGMIGHCMGGQIAQLFAAEYPDRVAKLALVGPVPASGIDLPEEARELFLNSGADRARQETILDMACLDIDEQSKEALLDDAEKIPAECIQQSFRAWTEGGFANRLGDISAETLVIASDDPLLPVEFLQAAVVDPISNARLEHVGGSGHYIQVERTDETAKLLGEFFS